MSWLLNVLVCDSCSLPFQLDPFWFVCFCVWMPPSASYMLGKLPPLSYISNWGVCVCLNYQVLRAPWSLFPVTLLAELPSLSAISHAFMPAVEQSIFQQMDEVKIQLIQNRNLFEKSFLGSSSCLPHSFCWEVFKALGTGNRFLFFEIFSGGGDGGWKRYIIQSRLASIVENDLELLIFFFYFQDYKQVSPCPTRTFNVRVV